MIDLGSHSMYLTRLFLGLPESVSATYGYITGRAVEDNAVVVLHYAEGKIGIAESGFVNRFSPFTIEVHGTEGSLLYGTPESKLQIRSPALGKDSWSVWTDVPADLPAPFQQRVSHIQQGTPATENIQAAIDLSTISAFSSALPNGNFVGSVTFAATAPISAVGLLDNFGPFAATPVVAGRAK